MSRTVALFCGSRDWTDGLAIQRDIDSLPPDAIVIEGGARGADRWARQYAQARGLHVATVNANWQAHGKAAGPWRNAAMLQLHPTIVYAYPTGGPGTRDMVRQTILAGIEVVVRRPSTP